MELYSATTNGVVHLASHETVGWVQDTAVYGHTLLVKTLGDLMEVVDIRSPSAPKSVEMTSGARREVTGKVGADIAVLPGALWGLRVHDLVAE